MLVWVWRVGAGGDGDAGTVKRGGMLEKNNVKVEYTFPESLVAQKVWRDYCTNPLVSAHLKFGRCGAQYLIFTRCRNAQRMVTYGHTKASQ